MCNDACLDTAIGVISGIPECLCWDKAAHAHACTTNQELTCMQGNAEGRCVLALYQDLVSIITKSVWLEGDLEAAGQAWTQVPCFLWKGREGDLEVFGSWWQQPACLASIRRANSLSLNAIPQKAKCMLYAYLHPLVQLEWTL